MIKYDQSESHTQILLNMAHHSRTSHLSESLVSKHVPVGLNKQNLCLHCMEDIMTHKMNGSEKAFFLKIVGRIFFYPDCYKIYVPNFIKKIKLILVIGL